MVEINETKVSFEGGGYLEMEMEFTLPLEGWIRRNYYMGYQV